MTTWVYGHHIIDYIVVLKPHIVHFHHTPDVHVVSQCWRRYSPLKPELTITSMCIYIVTLQATTLVTAGLQLPLL